MYKILLIIVLTFSYNTLKSHHKIYSPQVEDGRQSFEWRGHTDLDDRDIKKLLGGKDDKYLRDTIIISANTRNLGLQ